jgi:hypothetical protein
VVARPPQSFFFLFLFLKKWRHFGEFTRQVEGNLETFVPQNPYAAHVGFLPSRKMDFVNGMATLYFTNLVGIHCQFLNIEGKIEKTVQPRGVNFPIYLKQLV